MNWPYVICIVIVFMCGFKIGQLVITFNIAMRIQKLTNVEQTELKLLLKKMEK